ncbi:dihydroxyacetone kinase subunit DhaL [Streptomyces sp. TR02-1]|uniref:dihydroxyacetone kinase subunit DhaL n=1 Tax=Streptomyces sp. TR02-1 TaxID=3385977 RepID=UPI00399F33F3
MTNHQTDVLRTYTEAVHATEEALTALDQLSGDGDFGRNLREGLDRTLTLLDHEPRESATATAATAFLDHVGGTSGPLLGLLLREVGRALETEQDHLAGWSAGVREGLAAVQRVGEAEPGDRTMVDVLVPARDAFAAGASFTGVARTALAAAAATADMRARRGRASYVGARALGVPDPGAVGVALLFWALARVSEPGSALGDPADLVPVPERHG